MGNLIPFTAFLIALSNVGAASAYLAAVARLPFVAGIDRFLPSAFGKLHPRWKTPWVALLAQYILGVVFIFLGQAGTSVKGAYDVLVSMGVLTYFIPYLVLVRRDDQAAARTCGAGSNPRAGQEDRSPCWLRYSAWRQLLLRSILSMIPQSDEPNKPLAVLKIVGGTVVLVGIGVWIYWAGKRRTKPNLS